MVYGDLSTSPLYVYKSIFSGSLHDAQDKETVYGVLCLIFWTFTLIPLVKYVLIVLSANDNGEGESRQFVYLLHCFCLKRLEGHLIIGVKLIYFSVYCYYREKQISLSTPCDC